MVAPLDWGLGHATRCIPIIRALVSGGFEVMLAVEGVQANLLQTEFPALICIPLKGYRVRYSKHPAWLPLVLLQQLPRLFSVIRQENRWLDTIIREYRIDLVISDNRYGLFSPSIPCIFITHQLTVKAPFAWLEKVLQRINYQYINRFTACWVPDAAGEDNVAGVLSHPARLPKIPLKYIGLLSRFQPKTAEKKYDLCILLSGPEPQRTLLENKFLAELSAVPGKILLVRGKPGSKENIPVPDHVAVTNHLPNEALQAAIQQSDYVLSRSGYTTVMELLCLQKRSILIPTPGQTEQEYLAARLAEAHHCYAVSQSQFQFAEHFAEAKTFNYQTGSFPVCDPEQLITLIREIL